MKILLSPTKTLDFSRNFEKPTHTNAAFLKEAELLAGKMKKMSAKKIGELMHISADLAELNYQRFQQWTPPLEEDETCIPAVFAFTGEVFRGLDVATFSQEELLFAQNNLRILSGLYGILRPLDLMKPYRLEMGTKWNVTPKTKNLYAFWGSKIANNLNEVESDYIINLASTEYFKAVDLKKLKAKVITPIFKEFKNGEYKIVMTYAKHARGTMARFILKNGIQNPAEIKLFQVDGYEFAANLSTETDWVFIR